MLSSCLLIIFLLYATPLGASMPVQELVWGVHIQCTHTGGSAAGRRAAAGHCIICFHLKRQDSGSRLQQDNYAI